MWKNRHHRPNGYSERGLMVPFRDDRLHLGTLRVQPVGGDWEIKFPDFTGRATYVVPWEHLPHFLPLSEEDQGLYQAISVSGRSLKANSIRVAVQAVAQSGLWGRQAADAVEFQRQTELDLVHAIHFTLLGIAMAQAQDSHTAAHVLSAGALDAAGGRNLARQSLTEIAGLIGVDAHTVLDRLQNWSECIIDVGLPGHRDGRLRSALASLYDFRHELTSYAHGTTPDIMHSVQRAVVGLDETLKHSRKLLDRIDHPLNDVLRTLATWDLARDQLMDAVTRVTWLLESWLILREQWLVAGRNSQRHRLLERLAPFVPVVPSEELEIRITPPRSRRQTVDLLEDWHTGERIADLVHRIDSQRAPRFGAGAGWC